MVRDGKNMEGDNGKSPSLHPEEKVNETSRSYQGLSKTFLVMKTIVITLAMGCEGLIHGMVNPTLVDLASLYQVDYEKISDGLTGRSVGLFTAAVAGGYLYARFPDKQDILFALSMFLLGASTALIPWANAVPLLDVLTFLQGLGYALTVTGGNLACIEMWGKSAIIPLHITHVGVGAGETVAPLLVEPFLAPLCSQYGNTTPVDMTTAAYEILRDYELLNEKKRGANSTLCGPTRIQIPYAVAGGISCTVMVSFLVLYLSNPKRAVAQKRTTTESNDVHCKRSVKAILNPASYTGGRLCFGVQFLALYFFLLFAYEVARIPLNSFLYAIAVETDLQFTEPTATLLLTVFGAAYALGKVVPLFLYPCVSIQAIFVVEPILVLTFLLLLTFLGLQSQSMYWVFTCICAVATAPLFSTALSWVNEYIKVGAAISALSTIGYSLGGIAGQPLAGYVYQFYGAPPLLYMASGCAALSMVLVITLQAVATCNSNCTWSQNDVASKESLIN
ncbi:sodium-dependent glucose transporter 1 [Lingula anatina]|uniref:Sodium-dependent glucose transporter 1 n=1 Tax=Lingula anatina TaxID=7574 RepID=A0A1S3ILI4_LINAN|nr:sodium-dependent glucose transporter 1 [Lingula anatina]|eukprot:XP_013398948.1 sodium-dependent glucose transporter 1 [Lingula anatina]